MPPIPVPGAKCRPPQHDEGIITCIVRNALGKPCLMSCSHVLAPGSAPGVGDVVEWLDAGQSPPVWRRAGTLWKWAHFVREPDCNNLDIALALLDQDIAVQLAGAPGLQIAPYDLRYTGAAMKKFSVMLGSWVAGTIQTMFTTEDVPFDTLGNDSFKMCGLIESQVRNGDGDSGSIILVEDDLPIAIHIAGDSVDRAWSIPLQRAFDDWNLTLLSYPVPVAT